MQTNKSNGQLTAQVNLGNNQKSGFDLSNNVLGTGKLGRIIPTRALHVAPGDTIKADSKVAVQFEPLAVPILANMEVRQEHFYVPYNVVWKNWDKFISGGEKLDYNGIVPNVSMRKIISALSVFDEIVFKLKGSGNYDDNSAELIFENRADFVARQLAHDLEMLGEIGNDYGIMDLLEPQREALRQMRYFVRDSIEQYTPLFREYQSTLATAEVAYDNYLRGESLEGNKYITEIKPKLIEMLSSGRTLLPTQEGMQYLSLLYEFVKPLIGYGSNIDYLNMGRLSYAEFVYLYIDYLYNFFAHAEVTTNAEWANVVFAWTFTTLSRVNNLPLSVLNLRANYNIWYNNYRDILLEVDAMEPRDTDEVANDELFVLLIPRQRCWEKDAFTTALDNPGTGNVGVPVGVSNVQTGDTYSVYHQSGTGGENSEVNGMYQVEFAGEKYSVPTAFLTGMNKQAPNPTGEYQGFSLYQLDAAQRAQKWLQKALFFGNRISDFYYMRFGVRFLDARLRLPELLTSSSELVKLDVVMNNTNITTEAGGEVYQSVAGDRAAYASAYDNGNSFDRFCEEHGVIMSYLTIMPQATYAYGINRDYSRLDQFDFAFAEFATLGMDAVYDTEITATSLNDAVQVFGYQGRYYDYKAKHSEEHGELLDSQDMYTFARKFNMFDPNGRPRLNYEFVHCFPSLDMFVVDSPLADYFRYDVRHSTAAERQLPVHSIYI